MCRITDKKRKAINKTVLKSVDGMKNMHAADYALDFIKVGPIS